MDMYQNNLHLRISNDDIQTIGPTICVIQYQEKGPTTMEYREQESQKSSH